MATAPHELRRVVRGFWLFSNFRQVFDLLKFLIIANCFELIGIHTFFCCSLAVNWLNYRRFDFESILRKLNQFIFLNIGTKAGRSNLCRYLGRLYCSGVVVPCPIGRTVASRHLRRALLTVA